MPKRNSEVCPPSAHLFDFFQLLSPMFIFFMFIFIEINHNIKTGTLVFYVLFRRYPIFFWMMTYMEKAHNFQIASFWAQGVAQRCTCFFASFNQVLLIKKRVY